MTERELQAAVLQIAHMYGWRSYHTFDSRHSAAGFPDLTLVRRGRLVFCELKADKGKLTSEQRAWMEDLGDVAGVLACVVRPRDLQWIADVLGGS